MGLKNVPPMMRSGSQMTRENQFSRKGEIRSSHSSKDGIFNSKEIILTVSNHIVYNCVNSMSFLGGSKWIFTENCSKGKKVIFWDSHFLGLTRLTTLVPKSLCLRWNPMPMGHIRMKPHSDVDKMKLRFFLKYLIYTLTLNLFYFKKEIFQIYII